MIGPGAQIEYPGLPGAVAPAWDKPEPVESLDGEKGTIEKFHAG